MKSIQAEDKGTYICAIKQTKGSEPSIEKSQSINVIVVGKRSEKYFYLDVLNHQFKIAILLLHVAIGVILNKITL